VRSDTQLTASNLDETELLEIIGIEVERVKLYGKQFLKLIRNHHDRYEAMLKEKEDRPCDPNHQTVIDISSDEDYGDDDLDELADDASQEEQRSQYFRPPPEVERFNAQREWYFFLRKDSELICLASVLHTEHNPSTAPAPRRKSHQRQRWISRWWEGWIQEG